VSDAKADRSIAMRDGTRKSRAKQTQNRNVTPPVVIRGRKSKPKKGEHAMNAQLAETSQPADSDLGMERPEPAPQSDQPAVQVMDDDPTPPKDPWWTTEREDTYQLTLSGVHQGQIADRLARDRHTVARWQEDKRFIARLSEDNEQRFVASRQRRTMQTLRLTDKVFGLAETMLAKAEADPKDLTSRLGSRDWLQEFREQSRREDEIYGLNGSRVDVNVRGSIGHKHTGKVDVSFKDFLTGAMKNLGVDVAKEEVAPGRANDALIAITEKALMEGTFLEDLVTEEREQQLDASRLLTSGDH
jgi:hypothetical protein